VSIFESRQIMFHFSASVMGGNREVKLHLSSMRLNEINIVVPLIKRVCETVFHTPFYR
jgi:hypothetical protein